MAATRQETPAAGFLRRRWQRSVLGRFPGLGRLTTSSLLSETADQFAMVAIIWVTLVETGSPALAGLTVMCWRAPEIISGPVLGAWFDRLPPIRLTAIGFMIRGTSLAVIALVTLIAFNIWVVLAVCVIMGVTNPLAKVGTRVITPRLIPKGDLQVANGVVTIGDQFPYLVGPVLGGALAGLLGGWSLLVPTVLCVVATILISRVRIPQEDAPKPALARTSGTIWNDLVAGFRPMVTIPVVRAMMILTTIYFLSYGPLLTAIPVFAKDQLNTGGAGYGAMWSALGVGAVVGLVTIPWLSRFRPAVVNAVGAMLWGLVLLPLVLVTSLPMALVIMFVGGFVWAPYASTEISVIQDAVPPAQHGAVFGAQRSVIVASSPTGAALGGLLLLHLSASQVVTLSALACIVGGLCCLALPSVRRTRSLAQRATVAEREGDSEPTAPATAA